MKDDPLQINMLFWQRVEELRLARGMSERALSFSCFMSKNAYANGKKLLSAPGVDFVDGLARLLDVDASYLVTGFDAGKPYVPEDEPPPENPQHVLNEAKAMARRTQVTGAAIALVLGQNPDPRLGVDRILELFWRAEKMLRGRARYAAARKKKKKQASEKP